MSVLEPIVMEPGKLGILTMMAICLILELILLAIWVVAKYVLEHEEKQK